VSDPKFTPAPWQRHQSHIYGPDPERRLIGQLRFEGDGDGEQYLANQRIILAAPDLYEALESFISCMDRYGEMDEGCFYYNRMAATELHAPISKARAALAKARGEK